ncbi:MAG: aspartate 1-decarboxylase [Beijerinckiaceae bacterium]|nr:aspartate 1-decarboxylase [Beijerinckiaceae bacterium]
MLRTFVKSKIHRAKVTGADLNYVGSISICPELMKAAGMLEYEFVHVNNLSNGFHWETYAILGGPGEITLNGPPARNFCKDDLVVILTLLNVPVGDEHKVTHTVVFVDGDNIITGVETKRPAI